MQDTEAAKRSFKTAALQQNLSNSSFLSKVSFQS